jgi:membrane-associated protease RseP (regulator of RpoE activity)
MLILGAHELGHYFAARRHNLAVTLPYFIPFPVGLFGTLGAFIQLREPLKNRKMLLDVGAAGPLMGLIFAIPILFIGLSTSITGPISPGGLVEGNSLFYALAKSLVFGEFLPNGRVDVYVNQLAWAGWTGLFITGLNLIPLGQLDGGHVIYSLVGRLSRRLFYPTIVVLAVLTFISNGALLLLLVLLVILGRVYAVPLDDITALDTRRRWIAVLTLVIFLAVYVPIPLTQTEALPPLIPDRFGASLPLAYAAGALIVVAQRIGARWR